MKRPLFIFAFLLLLTSGVVSATCQDGILAYGDSCQNDFQTSAGNILYAFFADTGDVVTVNLTWQPADIQGHLRLVGLVEESENSPPYVLDASQDGSSGALTLAGIELPADGMYSIGVSFDGDVDYELTLNSSTVDSAAFENPARVRFAHLSADTQNVDIYVADEVVASDVLFGSVSDYLPMEAGIHPFAVVPTGTALDSALIPPSDVELLADHDYIYGIMGLAEDDTFQRLLIDETALFTDTSPGLAHVLFLDAMSGIAPVDARVEGSDQRFASGLEVGGYELTSVSPGEYPIVVSLASDTSQILLDQLNPVTLHPNNLYFVAAINSAEADEVEMVIKVTGALTISELIANTDNLNTLRALIEAAGLSDALSNRTAPPIMLFAPTDDAFTTAFDALGLEPGALLDSPDLLTSILSYHISPQIIASVDANQISTIPTLEGTEIQLSVDGNMMVLNGGARVTQGDILASNGIIHIIDALLIPPA
jgi:uncharacterized surface protein with fasciclin (FAS1) repeats